MNETVDAGEVEVGPQSGKRHSEGSARSLASVAARAKSVALLFRLMSGGLFGLVVIYIAVRFLTIGQQFGAPYVLDDVSTGYSAIALVVAVGLAVLSAWLQGLARYSELEATLSTSSGRVEELSNARLERAAIADQSDTDGTDVETAAADGSGGGWLEAEAREVRIQSARAAKAALTIDFLDFERQHSRASWFMTFLSAAIVVLVSVWAGTLVADLPASPSVAQLLRSTAVTIPGFLLFGLFAREAQSRRRHANWAAVTSTQLRSVEAFLATIEGDDALKDEIRLNLGKAVFQGGAFVLAAKGERGGGMATDHKTEPKFRQAVVVVHGMGDKKPTQTLRRVIAAIAHPRSDYPKDDRTGVEERGVREEQARQVLLPT